LAAWWSPAVRLQLGAPRKSHGAAVGPRCPSAPPWAGRGPGSEWGQHLRHRGGIVRVGVPREIKNHEYRVAITPAGVHELVRHGHEVLVERDAGAGSAISDAEYAAAGARVLDSADEVWGAADLVLKVKEPIAEEYHRLREGQVLFAY